jgi:hypothetical protein
MNQQAEMIDSPTAAMKNRFGREPKRFSGSADFSSMVLSLVTFGAIPCGAC